METTTKETTTEAPRQLYKIRIGRKWLKAGIVCKPGGAVLTDSEAEAGTYGAGNLDGPSMTSYLARMLLGYTSKIWIKPATGPGYWTY